MNLENEMKITTKNLEDEIKLFELTTKNLEDEIKLFEKTTEDLKGIKETLAMLTYRYMLDLFIDEIHVDNDTFSKTQKPRNIFNAINFDFKK